MYNGIGLQTARGSGTNGYVQTNKFFVRPRTGGKPGGKGFDDDQGTAGLSKKPNKAILEHDRKRQIHLKLAVLEDKLADQGYSDAEIAQKLEEARVNLEASATASEESDAMKISDTQTHQVAARKEKQMEAFRAALGLPDQNQVAEEGIIDDEPAVEAYEGRLKERREHSFLDRDSVRKRDQDVDEKDGKGKESKKQQGDDDDDDVVEVKRHKKKESKKRRHDDDSSESEEHGRDRRRRSKKKAKGRKQVSESESSSSDSESDSDSDDGKKSRRKKAATKKRSRSKRSVSSDSEDVESDDSKKLRKSHKKSRPSDRSVRSVSKEVTDRHNEQGRAGRKRHDSDASEPESEDDKQPLRKKEEAYRGGQKQKRVEENVVKDRYRDDSGGKKTARDSDDSEAEYENKKQLRSKVEVYSRGTSQKRDEEEGLSKHDKDNYRSDTHGKKVASDSDDSETEYQNRRKLKDERYQRGTKHTREEDEDHNNHGRDRYRSDDAVKRRELSKEDDDKMDRYKGRATEENDSDKGDDDRGRYRPRRETGKDDEHERDRYRGDAGGRSREREYSDNKGRSHYDGRSSGKRSSYGDRA